ncbi:MAG: SRPBCC family protein [Bacteroidota bacterium]
MRKLAKVVVGVTGIVAVAAGTALAFSPYGRRVDPPSPRLEETVDVAAPCGRVFTYLGDSSHARLWSVFINHITPLNPEVAADGAVGSIRRSFRNADEQGMRWDEEFMIVEPDRRRRLRIFNMVEARAPRDNSLMSEQVYRPLPDGGCRLAFTLFLQNPPSLADQVAVRLIAHQVSRVFRRNIANVKRLVEQGP